MISRLEAALCLALVVTTICGLASWETAADVAGAASVPLFAAFAGRVIRRRRRGKTWDEAWGRTPADDESRSLVTRD